MADNTRTQLRLADLSSRTPTTFDLSPDATARQEFADTLGIVAIKKLRLTGVLTPRGKSDWTLSADLGATVVQECAITLAPVTTRIDEPVDRHFVADLEEDDSGNELEMPEDDTIEALPAVLDLNILLTEALSLALPAFVRAEGASLGEAVYTAPGAAPMTDEDAKPFAGLGALKDQLSRDQDTDT